MATQAATRSSPALPAPWRDPSWHRLAALVLVASIGLGSILLTHLWLSGRSAVAGSYRAAEQTTLALEEHFSAVAQGVDAVLQQAMQRMSELSPAHSPADEIDVLRAATVSLPRLTALVHVNAAGQIVAHSDWLAPREVNIADRPFFRSYRMQGPQGLHLATLQKDPVFGESVLLFSRGLVTADGQFDGLVGATVSTDFFTNFIASLKIGDAGTVTLARPDGSVLIQGPNVATFAPAVADYPLFAERLGKATSGTYTSAAGTDGVERAFAYRTFEDYPLVVIVGIATKDVLATRRSEAIVFAGIWLGFVAVLLAAAAFMAVQLRRRTIAEWTLAQTQRAEERANAYLRDAIESLQDAFFLFDAKDRLVVANTPALEKIALAAERANVFPPAPEDDSAPIPFVAKGGPLEVEADGHWELIRERATADGGKVILHTDITPLKQREEQLARARMDADAANRAKSDFLATMSHEIRTPLNGLIGFTELLLGTKLDLQQMRYAEAVSDSGRMLLTLLNDILDYSRIEAGRVELESANFALRPTIASVVSSLQPTAKKKSLNLSMAIDPDVPEYVVGDPLRLKQILLNLLGNAIKFTEWGAVDVQVSRASPDPDQVLLRFDIHDTGIGIAEDVQGRLFERFSQADSSISRRYGGSGLGLAISKRLTELMGGKIGFESLSGRGSTFWFTVPFTEGTRPAVAPPPVAGLARRATRRILIVDDMEMNRFVAEDLLRRSGHDVTSVGSGPDAIELLRKQSFDLVLMDMQMPGMDGCAAAVAIQQLPGPAASTPIVALTANAMPAEVERCMQSGMRGHIAKPVDGAALEAAIQRWALRNAA